MNILFVCQHNRFRSKFAEAFFKKLNKKHNVKSAGAVKGRPIDNTIKELAKEFDVKISGDPHGLDYKLLDWQDMIIIVADDVPVSLFRTLRQVKKLKVWKIKEVHKADNKARKILVQQIYKRVKILSKELN
jgi:protein-tyrosine-phosphatase